MRRERAGKCCLQHGPVRKRPLVALQLFSPLYREFISPLFLWCFKLHWYLLLYHGPMHECECLNSRGAASLSWLHVVWMHPGDWMTEWFPHCWRVGVRRPPSLVVSSKTSRMTCWYYRKSWNSGIFISLHLGFSLLGAHSWLLDWWCGELGLPSLYSCCWTELFFSVMVSKTQDQRNSNYRIWEIF